MTTAVTRTLLQDKQVSSGLLRPATFVEFLTLAADVFAEAREMQRNAHRQLPFADW